MFNICTLFILTEKTHTSVVWRVLAGLSVSEAVVSARGRSAPAVWPPSLEAEANALKSAKWGRARRAGSRFRLDWQKEFWPQSQEATGLQPPGRDQHFRAHIAFLRILGILRFFITSFYRAHLDPCIPRLAYFDVLRLAHFFPVKKGQM